MGALTLNNKSKPGTPSAGPAPAVAQIPFTRAARMKSNVAAVTATQTIGAAAVPLAPIQIAAAGYLRGLECIVNITSAANAATVTTTPADQPWAVINQMSLVNSAGDNIISPVSGYQWYLMNKYGANRVTPPFNDPRRDPQFSALTTGAGATAGSGTFRLWIPVEVDPAQAFCAIPNLAANKAYNLNFLIAPTTAIYGVAPTTPQISITVIQHFWSQPSGVNGAGVAQQVAPPSVGSVALWQIETAPVTPGDRLVQSHNVGNVVREIIFVLRTAAGARTSADWPALSQIVLNNDLLFYLPTLEWQAGMAEAFGYNTGAVDVAGGLDTGVFVLYQFIAVEGGQAAPSGQRDQYLPTLDATLLQWRGTNIGASGNTLEILTNSIKPSSGSALYEPHYR